MREGPLGGVLVLGVREGEVIGERRGFDLTFCECLLLRPKARQNFDPKHGVWRTMEELFREASHQAKEPKPEEYMAAKMLKDAIEGADGKRGRSFRVVALRLLDKVMKTAEVGDLFEALCAEEALTNTSL